MSCEIIFMAFDYFSSTKRANDYRNRNIFADKFENRVAISISGTVYVLRPNYSEFLVYKMENGTEKLLSVMDYSISEVANIYFNNKFQRKVEFCHPFAALLYIIFMDTKKWEYSQGNFIKIAKFDKSEIVAICMRNSIRIISYIPRWIESVDFDDNYIIENVANKIRNDYIEVRKIVLLSNRFGGYFMQFPKEIIDAFLLII